MPLPKAVILISGRGSNMQQLVKAAQTKQLAVDIQGIISNQESSKGLAWAEKEGLNTFVLSSNERNVMEKELHSILLNLQADWVLLAGFIKVLSAEFVRCWKGKLINIHPSLLPLFPGLNTHQRALDKNCKEHGASVHFVLEKVDTGPVIMQAKLPIMTHHNVETLAQDVLMLEHQLFPKAIQSLINFDIQLYDDQTITMQGNRLSSPLLLDA